MKPDIERNLGPQPIENILEERHLTAHQLVSASTAPMTHKMIARARKGRRLTRNTQEKVLNALNKATGENFALRDLFTY